MAETHPGTETPTRITERPGTEPAPIRRLLPDELCPQQKTDVGTKIRRIVRP